MKEKHIVVFLIVLLCVCACEQPKENINVTAPAIEKNEEEFETIIFEEPDEFYAKGVVNCIFGDNGEYPCYYLLINEGKKMHIKYYLLDLKEGWKEESVPWIDKFELQAGEELDALFTDSSENYYAYVSNNQRIGMLYCYSKNMEKRTLDITKVFDVYPELDFFTLSLTNDDKLVFFFGDNDKPEWNDAMSKVVLYDPITETVIATNEKIDPLLSVFGPDNSVYYVAEAQKGIMGKNLKENIVSKFISCEGITGDGSSRITIRDDKGYLCSSKGLYGGSFDDKEWKQIIPAETYNKMDGEQWKVSGFMKVPGDDKEFLLNLYEEESGVSKWVYCY